LSAFRNVHHKGSKNFDLKSCVSTSKVKTSTTKESLELRIVYSLPTRLLDYVDSSEIFSNSVLFLAENWMRDTVLFVLRNRKLEMLVDETLPKLFT